MYSRVNQVRRVTARSYSSTSQIQRTVLELKRLPPPTVPNGFSYQTKTSYNGIRALTAGTGLDTDHLVVGRIRLKDQPRSFHGGYKSFVLFNRTLTTEELAYVERWMA